MRGLSWIWVGALLAGCPHVFAADEVPASSAENILREAGKWPGVIRSHLGVTRKGTRIPCIYHEEDLELDTKKTRVLLVSGFEDRAGSLAVLEALRWFSTSEDARPLRERFVLSAVPWVNPDNVSPPRFPPKGEAYFSPQNAEAEYLWRWIGMHAPDLVVAVALGEREQWTTSAEGTHPAGRLVRALDPSTTATGPVPPADFVKAVMTSPPCDVGTIPAVLAVRKSDDPRPEALLQDLFRAIGTSNFQGQSPARKELLHRLDRTPVEMAKQLSKVYGHELGSVQYIPALALVGRLWLGELTDDPSHRADVERIVVPYVAGEKRALPQNFSGSHLAGHLIFAELARTTEDPEQAGRYRELARKAAETGFEQGEMKQAMPAHNEMSDAVFMGCPILAEAGVLTGEDKYLKMANRHFAFMRERVLRPDGIYRHSPLCETAWGRGNGFPALGLAWSLSVLPKDHPLFRSFLKEFQSHIQALVKHQDPSGMWRQVIDDEGSYRELTATSMITFAMIRGVRSGWLDEAAYRPVIEKAFRALQARIAEDGTLVDVCTGTGKQNTLRDYYHRKAILGRDPRGGAMALLVTTEMARWQRGNE